MAAFGQKEHATELAIKIGARLMDGEDDSSSLTSKTFQHRYDGGRSECVKPRAISVSKRNSKGPEGSLTLARPEATLLAQ